jgi:hypothetical protein
VVAIGDVDRALTSYYDDQLAAVAAAGEAGEREIRAWFERALITEQGLRGQVLRGKTHSQGLHNRVIGRLIDTHIVRAEQRRGMTWFELAHDRMIGPVRASNARWVEEHLSPTQRHAELWDSRGRPEGLLLADMAVIDGAAPQGAVEREFVEVSRRVRLREAETERLRRESLLQRRLMTWGAIAALVVAVVVLRARNLDEKKQMAHERELRAKAQAELAVVRAAADRALARQLTAEAAIETDRQMAVQMALVASRVTDGADARAGLVRVLGGDAAGQGLEELRARGCRLVGRELTADEWTRLAGSERPQVPVCSEPAGGDPPRRSPRGRP